MNIKVIENKKFKDIKVSINFLSKLDEETYLHKYILADLLSNTCNAYPTKKKAIEKVAELYGTSVNTATSISGDGICFTLSSSSINSKYIKEDLNLFDEQIKMIAEYLLNPKVNNNQFASLEYEEAKRMGIAKFTRKIDHPSAFSVFKALEIVGGNQSAGIIPAFNIDKLKALKNEDTYKYYLDMIKNDRVDIIVCGDISENEVINVFNKYFDFKDDGNIYYNYDFKKSNYEKLYYGHRDITQAYLTLMYYSPFKKNDPDYFAYVLGNKILGLMPSSLLFQEVREKNSLCYSISSAPMYDNQLMYITTGIELANIDKTIDLCQKQVERMQNGDFDDSLVETSKLVMFNSLNAEKDSSTAIINRVYYNIINQYPYSNEEMMEQISKVSKDDIVQAMKRVEYLSGYVLRKGEEENGNN